jgi:RNA polymerase sigma factor (sigma-70 family)
MTTQLNDVLRNLRRAGLLPDPEQPTDGELLESFVSRRDGAAVETLVRRHGPMVWGVCRRVLHNHHDAEDAFQATFLVLVRRAASVRPRALVGNWLYGVAHQTALKARQAAAKHRARQRQVANMPEPAAKEPDASRDWQAVLDQELSRLPDMYRVAIVLCDLEGKTRREAARQLGVPDGTLAARVARARTMLARRLARHGVLFSGGSLAAVLAESAASASMPKPVLISTIKAVTSAAAGRAATGLASAGAGALAEGVVKAMLISKLKATTGLCLALTLLLGIGVAVGRRAPAADRVPPAPPKENLADTLILLDKQLWEATSNYDVETVGKILADDWIGYSATGPLT